MQVMYLMINPLLNAWMNLNYFIVKQTHFNAQVQNQLNENSLCIKNLHATLGRTVNDVKGLVKHFEMIQTQLEQLTKVQNDLFSEMSGQINKQACSVKTRGGAFTQDPLYPEGHPKRLEQDSQMLDENVRSEERRVGKECRL